ncbi:hypothetical protein HDU91_000952 [Kappamyces sp. JEL0680]|nr:hypothetical protein HDU91_000952 [Kappamyces sp. JEL0680]
MHLLTRQLLATLLQNQAAQPNQAQQLMNLFSQLASQQAQPQGYPSGQQPVPSGYSLPMQIPGMYQPPQQPQGIYGQGVNRDPRAPAQPMYPGQPLPQYQGSIPGYGAAPQAAEPKDPRLGQNSPNRPFPPNLSSAAPVSQDPRAQPPPSANIQTLAALLMQSQQNQEKK